MGESRKKLILTLITIPQLSLRTITGIDFMKATWSIWFGKIDQKELGDQLLKGF